jgi:quinol monooxygenase YgiN
MKQDDSIQSVTMSIAMRFAPANMDPARQLLLSGIECTQAKPDCHECMVALDATDHSQVHYHEAWQTEAAFHRHIQSPEFRRVLAAMDMCCEEPSVTIGNLSGRSGIAHLQALYEEEL